MRLRGTRSSATRSRAMSRPGSTSRVRPAGRPLANNVAIDNGLRLQVGGGTASGQATNIRVDARSITRNDTRLRPDRRDRWHVPNHIQWNGTSYTSLAAFQTAVSGQEVHGLQADPLFVTPAAVAQRPAAAPFNVAVNVGDYHLTEGSPAIDSADSGASNETATDLDGHARVDDPATTDTGAGSRTYDDRGAYEFAPSANVPASSSARLVRRVTNPSNSSGSASSRRDLVQAHRHRHTQYDRKRRDHDRPAGDPWRAGGRELERRRQLVPGDQHYRQRNRCRLRSEPRRPELSGQGQHADPQRRWHHAPPPTTARTGSCT